MICGRTWSANRTDLRFVLVLRLTHLGLLSVTGGVADRRKVGRASSSGEEGHSRSPRSTGRWRSGLSKIDSRSDAALKDDGGEASRVYTHATSIDE